MPAANREMRDEREGCAVSVQFRAMRLSDTNAIVVDAS